METITVTERHVERLRRAGPSAWLIFDGHQIRVTDGRHDPLGVIEIATGNALTDLAEIYRSTGAVPTDSALAVDLTALAARRASSWPLTCLMWPLLRNISIKLADVGLTRCEPASLFVSEDNDGDDVLGIRQSLAATGHTHTDRAPHLRLEITAHRGDPVTIALNGRTHELAGTTPPAAVATFCAAMLSEQRHARPGAVQGTDESRNQGGAGAQQ